MVKKQRVLRSGKPAQSSTPTVERGRVFLRLALVCAALAVLVAAAYGNSTGNGFVWDDHEQIVANPHLKADAPLGPLFTTDARFTEHTQGVQGKDYRPLQLLAYRLVYGSFGADAAAFHVLSIVFTAACAVAAFAVFFGLTRRWGVAAAAATLFAVYPVHTEAVDWISALPELGYSLCLLVSFWSFLAAWSGRAGRPRWWMAALSWLAFGAGLLWKETAAVFPVAIVGYVLLVGGSSGAGARLRELLQRSAPYWAVLAAYVAVRAQVLGGLSAGQRDWALSPWQFGLNAIYLLVCYGAKLALPVHLNAYDTFVPIRSVADGRGVVAVLGLLAVAAAAALLWRKRRVGQAEPAAVPVASTSPPALRLAAFAALWVLVFLLPAMNLRALGRNAFSERYLYLSSAGWCLLAVLAVDWALGHLPTSMRKAAGAGLLALALLGCTVETAGRNEDWKDDATLFAVTLESSPDAPFVRNMVAAGQSNDPAQAALAEENYKQAIALANGSVPPDGLDAVVAYRGLASVYADRGRFQEALQTLAEASRIDPDDADTDGERGLILARSGHGREAEPLLRRALAEEPENENVLSALGVVERDDLHHPNEAALLFQRALAAHGMEDDFAASQHNNLAAAYADAGKLAAATEEMRTAVRIVPTDPEFHVNLAQTLAAEGDFQGARAEAEAAMRIAPDDPAPREVLEKLNAVPR